MGAAQFVTRAKGKDVNQAFSRAREDALYQSGHGGYTGTIAEKDGYVLLDVPEGMTAQAFVKAAFEDIGNPAESPYPQSARMTIAKAHDVADDKWGPCVAVKDGDDFVFFGWASE